MRIDFIRRNILNDAKPSLPAEKYFNSLKVLDVGCGAGILAEGLGRLGMGSVTGIDPTIRCVELAEEHVKLDPELR